MMKSVLNHGHHNVLAAEQQPSQLPDHLKCGEVYTWLCNGELYAVECQLCEDHPLCPLSEFPQHMQVWHTDWQQTGADEADNEDLQNSEDEDPEPFGNYDEDHNDEHALSFTTEDSGLFEPDDGVQNERMSNLDLENHEEEMLEPFEQVLIEQDNTLDSIQISEDVNEEECREDEVNKQVAEDSKQSLTEREPEHNIFVHEKHKQKENSLKLAVQERELRYLPTITESEVERNANETEFENLNQEMKYIRNPINNLKGNTTELSENKTRELGNSKSKNIERALGETSESETSETVRNNLEYLENKQKCVNNLKPAKNMRKSLRISLEQLRNSKEEMLENETATHGNETNKANNKKSLGNLKGMAANSNDFRETKEKETETSENETQDGKTEKSLRNLPVNKTKPLENETLEQKTKNVKTNLEEMAIKPKDLQKPKENATEASGNETNERKTKKSLRNFREFTTKSKDLQEAKENETITSEQGTEIAGNETICNRHHIPPTMPESTEQNLRNIRRSLRNFRKNTKSIQDLQESKANVTDFTGNLQEPQNTFNSQSEVKENLGLLKLEEQEEMKQKEFAELTTRNDVQQSSKFPRTRRNSRKCSRDFREQGLPESETSNDDLQSFKARRSRRNSRKCSRDYKEEELTESETRSVKENSTKSSTTKLKNHPRHFETQLNEEEDLKETQVITASDLSIKKSIDLPTLNQQIPLKSRPTKRNLRSTEGVTDIPGLKPCKTLKHCQTPPKQATRVSPRSGKRKNELTNDVAADKPSRKERFCQAAEILEDNSKEEITKTAKQTLLTQYFDNKNTKPQAVTTTQMETSQRNFNEMSPNDESNIASNSTMDASPSNTFDTNSLNSYSSSQGYSSRQDNSSPLPHEPLSPLLSPKSEEEHFEFDGPKEKLEKHHVSHLIKLYQDQALLWDQSHTDYCEPQQCRKSWQQITEQWNAYCQRQFTTAEVRIRLGTLCQRYVQERERLALEGELDEFAKFPYYEQMQFLEQQKSLQQRSDVYEQQNEKILEIYQHFPLLWEISHYKFRQAKQRAEAFESISRALKLSGLHLSSMAVQKRIRSLRKCYRLEKIRYLHAQVEQMPFSCNFRHYERMQFLHKHIEPFVCRICSKIFENLVGFREHLEQENHGSLLQEDSEGEELEKETLEEHQSEENREVLTANALAIEDVPASFNHDVVYSPEAENSCDILQTFTPLSTTPNPDLDTACNLNLADVPIIQEVLIFPSNTPAEPLIHSLHIEDQLMEEIMENVTNDDSLTRQSLDHFIDSVTSYEKLSENNVVTEETLACAAARTENTIILPIPSPETNLKETAQDNLAGHQATEPISLENPPSTSPLVVKVQCADFSLDLKLNPDSQETSKPDPTDSDSEFYSSSDISTLPLPDREIHKMIELYRKYPQLWNPNHLDYNSRNLRRQAWCSLTREFNCDMVRQYSWRTMHRKLTDYAKYYKKLITEQEDYERLENKWTFYEDFKFLDDVIVVHDELQRTVHHRDNNIKIIKIYETLPQLWDIKHPDYNKRSTKQRNIELMCNRLQEENNLQLTTERLKNRLIELRAQYRAAKKQRLKCERLQQKFNTDFECYEAFNFIDPHIDPFKCEECKQEFKKLTDYNLHLKRVHKNECAQKQRPPSVLPHEPGVDKHLQNVCHICGNKFSTRSNLVHHVKRHEGIRNYQCPMCPKKFFASHPLNVHIRSHTKECPYTCEKCGVSFVSASKLNQHVKRHLNKRDFQCDYCPKSFYTAFEKDRHERRHLNIRDKVCGICGKTFVVGSSYYAHMMLHSDTKRYECDKCELRFAQYAGLYKHKKKYHPA